MKPLPKYFDLQLSFCEGNAFLKSYTAASMLRDPLGMKRWWDLCGSRCRSSLLSDKELGKGGNRRRLITPCYSFILGSPETSPRRKELQQGQRTDLLLPSSHCHLLLSFSSVEGKHSQLFFHLKTAPHLPGE